MKKVQSDRATPFVCNQLFFYGFLLPQKITAAQTDDEAHRADDDGCAAAGDRRAGIIGAGDAVVRFEEVHVVVHAGVHENIHPSGE